MAQIEAQLAAVGLLPVWVHIKDAREPAGLLSSVVRVPNVPAAVAGSQAHRWRSMTISVAGSQAHRCRVAGLQGCRVAGASMAINRNPRHSNGIHRRQYQSVTISDNQWQSVAISGNQWQSVAISDNQWQSVAISGNQWHSLFHWQAGAFTCRCQGNRCTGPRRARAALRPTRRRGWDGA